MKNIHGFISKRRNTKNIRTARIFHKHKNVVSDIVTAGPAGAFAMLRRNARQNAHRVCYILTDGSSVELQAVMQQDPLSKQVHAFRKTFFIDGAGYAKSFVQERDGGEYDEFDRPETCHIVALDAAKNMLGVIRLNPARAPHLLGKVKDDFMIEPYKWPDKTWDLSRLGVACSQKAEITALLLGEAMGFCHARGGRKAVAYTPEMHAQFLQDMGIKPRIFRKRSNPSDEGVAVDFDVSRRNYAILIEASGAARSAGPATPYIARH